MLRDVLRDRESFSDLGSQFVVRMCFVLRSASASHSASFLQFAHTHVTYNILIFTCKSTVFEATRANNYYELLFGLRTVLVCRCIKWLWAHARVKKERAPRVRHSELCAWTEEKRTVHQLRVDRTGKSKRTKAERTRASSSVTATTTFAAKANDDYLTDDETVKSRRNPQLTAQSEKEHIFHQSVVGRE